MTSRMSWVILLVASLATLSAQNETRRASMRGSRGDTGKCTIEVNVDGVAEIEIRGDEGVLHTLQGIPANWVRFECNDALPRLPDDFKFSGVDGRGRQTLIRDPRDNRGVAVIRIEDPKGGREGYTFDIEWRGYANSITNQRPGSGNNSGNGGKRGGFGSLDRRYDLSTSDDRTRPGAERAINVCTEAVRTKVNRDYGYRNIDIGRIALDDNPGRRDWIVGQFVYRRGLSQEQFDFGCSVDFNNGRVRNVEIKRW